MINKKVFFSGLLAVTISVVLCYFYWHNSVLIIEPDSGGYLLPVIDRLSTGAITVANSRSVGYPLILYSMISLDLEIQAVVFFQGYLLMFAILFSTYQLYKVLEVFGLRTVIALIGSYMYFAVAILTSSNWVYAQSILTEGIVIPLKIIVMALMLRGIIDKKIIKVEFILYSSCLIIILPYLYIVRAHDLIFIFISAGFWCLMIFKSALNHKKINAFIFLVLTASGILGMQSIQRDVYLSSGGSVPDLFGIKSIYCNNLKIINPQESNADIRDRANFLIIQDPKGWKINGFNGDSCYYDEELNDLVNNKFNTKIEKYHYYKSIIIKSIVIDPDLWIYKIFKQISHVHLLPAFIVDQRITGSFPAFQYYKKYAEERLVSIDFGSRYDKTFTIGSKYLLRMIELLYLLSQIMLAISILLWFRYVSTRLVTLWIIVNVLLLSNLAIVSIAHTYDVSRYQHSNVTLYLMSTFVFFAILTRVRGDIKLKQIQ